MLPLNYVKYDTQKSIVFQTSVTTDDKMPWGNYFVHNSILKSKIIRIALNNKPTRYIRIKLLTLVKDKRRQP